MHQVTVSSVGAYIIVTGTGYEKSSGGPFLRDIDDQGSALQEVWFYMNSKREQSAAFSLPAKSHSNAFHDRILPNHVNGFQYFFPSSKPLFPQPPRFTLPAFLKSFTRAFASVVVSGGPNEELDKEDTENITPPWPAWDAGSEKEMLFSRTESREPDVRAIDTNAASLERCRISRWWNSVAELTAQ